MAKELNCPHCKMVVEIAALQFSDSLDMICKNCSKVIFPTTEGKDSDLKKLFPTEQNLYMNKKEPLPIIIEES